ncbi:MAG: hypothetical protein N2506_04315 [Dehalococcoidales bacterium]|nr:hypothetical protein [Dehalococcoidales bacterium]
MVEEKVLSQAEIDALVAKMAKPDPPKKSPEPKPAVQEKPPVAERPPITERPPVAEKPPVAERPPAERPQAVPRPPVVESPASAAKPAAVKPQTAAKRPPLPPSRPGSTRYEKYSSREGLTLRETLVDISRQVAKVTGMVHRLEMVEERVAQIYSLLKLDPSAANSLGAKLDQIIARLDELEMRVFDLQGEFECARCKSRRLVAVHVKCTSCGEETWMGWFPEAKDALETHPSVSPAEATQPDGARTNGEKLLLEREGE